jgi:hypothetical protein
VSEQFGDEEDERRSEMLGRVGPLLIERGWRLLEDHEVIERTDSTACLSTLLADHEGWTGLDEPHPDLGDEWASAVGQSVGQYITSDPDMDGWERIFRRRTEV